ncbi:hypothetical protein [Nibricoccus sp. IMCC34717]|uniref:hypothetical protein n=1 Tax=Nibricoccus sp. IMCC34717 TaxID=3034021 RepID=UPI00384CCFC6
MIPVSEEVFWLALAAPSLPKNVSVRTSALPVLEGLHHKAKFASMAGEIGYGAPENHLVSSPSELRCFADPQRWVFKPVYSRFASRLLVKPDKRALSRIRPTPTDPWLAQTFVPGVERCCYNVAENGRILFHVAYSPVERLGVGAGLYFEPYESGALFELSRRFIEATAFTGQISFDVIESGDQLVAIECNPRGTSGVHLGVQHSEQLSEALLGIVSASPKPICTSPRMLRIPLLLTNPWRLFTRSGLQRLSSANDALTEAGIGLGSQTMALAEMIFRAIRQRIPLREATTWDIEWNGERSVVERDE